MAPPKTKDDMYREYERGLYGSKPLTWPTLDAVRESGFAGLIGLRYSSPKGGGAWFKTELTSRDAEQVWAQWVHEGADPKRIKISQSVSPNHTLIQGELLVNHEFYLLYSTEKRKANRPNTWARPQIAKGLTAKLILESLMSPASWDNLQELLVRYQHADEYVIEFTTVDYELHDGHNTVFWEVRAY